MYIPNGKLKVGEYYWEQLSMWDFAPKGSIQRYRRSECGKHVFHYYLKYVVDEPRKDSFVTRTVLIDEYVPEEILAWNRES